MATKTAKPEATPSIVLSIIGAGGSSDKAKLVVDSTAEVKAKTFVDQERRKDLLKDVHVAVLANRDTKYIDKVVFPEHSGVKIDYRLNGAIASEQYPDIEGLFGVHTDELWEETTTIDEITNYADIINDLQIAGINPKDALSLSVKPGWTARVLKATGSVTLREVLTPKEEFMATLTDLAGKGQITPEAKDFLTKFLDGFDTPEGRIDGALKPVLTVTLAKEKIKV